MLASAGAVAETASDGTVSLYDMSRGATLEPEGGAVMFKGISARTDV